MCLGVSLGCGLISTTTKVTPPPVFQTAGRQQLIDKIEKLASIESMKSTIYITLTVESEDRAEKTQHREVRGALVTRRPRWIRTTAQTPGGMSKAIDMVSNGDTFQVHVPWKNLVYEGDNALDAPSDNRAENIRPQHILTAIMFAPIQQDQMILMDTESYGRTGYQVVHIVDRNVGGEPKIRRKYWFARDTLALARLQILDDDSELATDAWYRDWQDEDGLPYPKFAQIRRPQDGYQIDIQILKAGLNETVPDTSFVLTLPEDIEVERIGKPAGEQTAQASND